MTSAMIVSMGKEYGRGRDVSAQNDERRPQAPLEAVAVAPDQAAAAGS